MQLSQGYVVANIIYSKNESKSQQRLIPNAVNESCGKYHIFKERKQITTESHQYFLIQLLWQISYIQRTKANHNQIGGRHIKNKVVANIIYSKNESKSQRNTQCIDY